MPRPLSAIGQPQAGAFLIFFLTGTTTPANVYADGDLTTPLSQVAGTAQPSCTADFAGRFNQIYLDPSVVYRVQLYSPIGGFGFTLMEDTDPYVVPGVPNAATIYAPGNINRYGTNVVPGTTDMSTALTAALSTGLDVYIPAGTYLFAQNASFTLQSNQQLYGDGALSVMNFSYCVGSNLAGVGVTDTVVKNVKLVVSATTNAGVGYAGVVAFTALSTNCVVEGCDISGFSNCGVFLQDSSNCTIRRNYFHGAYFNTANGDGASIYLRGTNIGGAGGCQYNVITENQVFATTFHGIAILTGSGATPYGSTGLNLFNIISNNRVGQQQGYGILNYCGNVTPPASTNWFNQIIGNYVENCQGANVAGGSAGAGIYSVGASGITISGNTVHNCCQTTANDSLAPAGIGISQVGAGMAPCIVSGNNISAMTQYHGIKVTASAGPVNVVGNTVLHPVSNSTGTPIQINGSSFAKVNCNVVVNNSTQQGIWVHIVAATLTQIDITANKVSGAGAGILFDVTSGSLTQTNVSDNDISSSAAANGIVLAGIAQGNIKGNNINVGATNAITISACTRLRVSGNNCVCSASALAITITGACTDSYVDESNYFIATGGANVGMNAVSNAGTGIYVSQIGAAAAGASTHALGDRIKNNGQSVTNVLDWLCTVAGTPGTWTGSTLP